MPRPGAAALQRAEWHRHRSWLQTSPTPEPHPLGSHALPTAAPCLQNQQARPRPGSSSRRQGVSRGPRGRQGPGTNCMGQSHPVSATSWSEPGPHPQHPGWRAASRPCSSCKGGWAGEPSHVPLRARPRVAATPASLCGTLGHSLSWVLTGASPVSPSLHGGTSFRRHPQDVGCPRNGRGGGLVFF